MYKNNFAQVPMAESRRSNHPDLAALFGIEDEMYGERFARLEPQVDKPMARLWEGIAQLSQTMEKLEINIDAYRKMSLIAEAFGGKPLPIPPELKGWV